MFNWIFDRIWASTHRAELAALDAQMDYLNAEGERLEGKMVEHFGPDWRAEAERRLQKRLAGDWSVT